MTNTVLMHGSSAVEETKHFVYSWRFNCGPLEELITYNGVLFTFKFFQKICKIMKVETNVTLAYHPESNGQGE